LLLAVAAAAAAWSTASWGLFSPHDLAWSLGDSPVPVAIEGEVVDVPRLVLEPPHASSATAAAATSAADRLASEIVIAIRRVRNGSAWRSCGGRATVIVAGAPPAVAMGQSVRIFGRGLRPPPALNPGEFDARDHARAARSLSLVRVPTAACITRIGGVTPPSFASWIERLRQCGAATLRACIAPERAPLAAALLLGGREALPRDDAEDFLVTGTVHILSISGLHVGLLAVAICWLLRFLGLRPGALLMAVIAITGLYMLVVRAETPVVRSTLVVWLACLGAVLGRRSQGMTALAVAAIIVLAWQPAEVFRTGAQLSFLSTAVLVVAGGLRMTKAEADDPIARLIERSRPPLERRLRRMGRWVADLFLTSAAVWAVTAPIVAATFHVISPVGLLLNPLIAPLVAVAMGWGFACLVMAMVSQAGAVLCGQACDATLRCIMAIVSWGSDLPGAYVWVAGPPAWWVAGWYLILGAALLGFSAERLRRPATWALVAGCWLAVGGTAVAVAAVSAPRCGPLRAVVAAMGHGCGIVVRSPTGRCLVYDAGRLGAPGAASRAMSAVLWEERVRRIDTLVVSHADADHFNALPALLERFAIGEIVVSRPFLRRDVAAVGELLLMARQRRIPVRTVSAGDSFALDALCRVRVLHPAPRDAAVGHTETGRWPTDNERSLVLAVEAAGRRLLLTGDLEGRALESFVAADPDSCDVLVAPHHGSRTSLPPDIARATAPEIVVVSGPGGRSWPEVRAAYEAAVPDRPPPAVHKTGAEGAIALDLAAEAVSMSRFTRGAWRLLAKQAP